MAGPATGLEQLRAAQGAVVTGRGLRRRERDQQRRKAQVKHHATQTLRCWC